MRKHSFLKVFFALAVLITLAASLSYAGDNEDLQLDPACSVEHENFLGQSFAFPEVRVFIAERTVFSKPPSVALFLHMHEKSPPALSPVL